MKIRSKEMCAMARRRELAAVTLAVCAMFVSGCGKKESGSSTPQTDASSKTAAQQPAAATPAPKLAASSNRDTPVAAAESMRRLAETSTDPSALAPYLDPSQAAVTSKILAPMMLYRARVSEITRLANTTFGPGAGDAVASTVSYTVEFGNGIREMFDAHHFEDVRRDSGKAYVMATLENGQPIGAPLVFRENQGEWLLLLSEGDNPWPESKLGTFGATLAGPLQGALNDVKRFDTIITRLKAGEIKSLDQLTAALAGATQG